MIVSSGTVSSLGNATRVSENPDNPPVFRPVNPSLCAGKNPGLMGLNFGHQYCTEKACRNRKQLKCGDKSETVKYNNTINNPVAVFLTLNRLLTDIII